MRRRDVVAAATAAAVSESARGSALITAAESGMAPAAAAAYDAVAEYRMLRVRELSACGESGVVAPRPPALFVFEGEGNSRQRGGWERLLPRGSPEPLAGFVRPGEQWHVLSSVFLKNGQSLHFPKFFPQEES
jgi:hypothetical protein